MHISVTNPIQFFWVAAREKKTGSNAFLKAKINQPCMHFVRITWRVLLLGRFISCRQLGKLLWMNKQCAMHAYFIDDACQFFMIWGRGILVNLWTRFNIVSLFHYSQMTEPVMWDLVILYPIYCVLQLTEEHYLDYYDYDYCTRIAHVIMVLLLLTCHKH